MCCKQWVNRGGKKGLVNNAISGMRMRIVELLLSVETKSLIRVEPRRGGNQGGHVGGACGRSGTFHTAQAHWGASVGGRSTASTARAGRLPNVCRLRKGDQMKGKSRREWISNLPSALTEKKWLQRGRYQHSKINAKCCPLFIGTTASYDCCKETDWVHNDVTEEWSSWSEDGYIRSSFPEVIKHVILVFGVSSITWAGRKLACNIWLSHWTLVKNASVEASSTPEFSIIFENGGSDVLKLDIIRRIIAANDWLSYKWKWCTFLHRESLNLPQMSELRAPMWQQWSGTMNGALSWFEMTSAA